jgi:DNA polymerase-3 subunit alpha
LESLIKSGAFDFAGEHRASLFARLDQIIAGGASAQKDKASGQISLFGDDVDFGAPPSPTLDAPSGANVPQWSLSEILNMEKELLGFYVSGHPLDPWWPVIDKAGYQALGDVDDLKDELKGKKPKFGVFLKTVTVKYTKAGKQFAIVLGEDFTGQKEFLCWSETWEKHKESLVEGAAVEIQAKCEPDSRTEGVQLMANSVKVLDKPTDEQLAGPRRKPAASKKKTVAANSTETAPSASKRYFSLVLNPTQDGREDLQAISRILQQYPGGTAVRLLVRRPGAPDIPILTGEKFRVEESAELYTALEAWLE